MRSTLTQIDGLDKVLWLPRVVATVHWEPLEVEQMASMGVLQSHLPNLHLLRLFLAQHISFFVTETERKLSHIIRDRARLDSVSYFLAAKGPSFRTHLDEYGNDEVVADFITEEACHVL